jgi:NAD-dependent DNA ligase
MQVKNKVVAFTGRLPISNAKAKVVLEVAGASIRKDVSRRVELLVTASNPGPVILRKAELLGIPVVPWSKLRLGKHQRALENLLTGSAVV